MSVNGNIIARYTMPKQRATNPFSIVIRDGDDPADYSVHTLYHTGGMGNGKYDLTWERAHAEFSERVKRDLEIYSPEVYEINELA